MKYFIGLDAHSKTSTFAVVDEQGQCTHRQTVDTTENNLSYFINQINGERHLTFEESTISQWLYLQLREHVDELIVCNPVYITRRPGAKTDFLDALHLAQELRGNHLKPVFHDESHWIQLRVSVSGYLDVVSEITRSKNRLKAVFRAEAIKTNEGDFYKNKHRTIELKNDSAKFVAERLFAQVEYLEEEKQKYIDLFKQNQKKYRPIRNLMTLPGIKIVRANIIAALVCQPDRFFNKHKFWGYCMLVRHIQKSGGKIYGNKRIFGRRELRNCFIGAAEAALRGETSVRDHYDILRARGVKHKDALISTARLLAAISLSCLKNNEPYHDNYKERIRERKELRIKLSQK